MPAPSRLRVALLWCAEPRLVDITTRFEPYVQGFTALGHDVITVCARSSAEGYAYPVRTTESLDELAGPALWRELRPDVVVAVTWHRMADVLAAVRASGARVVALADSDGRVSPRLHPGATWRFAVLQQPGWLNKLRASKFWAQRFVYGYRAEHRRMVDSARRSDVQVFCSRAAAEEFRKVLRAEGADDLAPRLAAVPYPVGEPFHARPVATERRRQVVAIGRWDAAQKNPRLLAAAMERFLERDRATEFVLIGKGGEQVFKHHPRVRVAGVLPPKEVADHLAASRVLALSSRWESGPIVAFEALALGTTVVSSPLPNLAEFLEGGAFGTVSDRATPRSLADALHRELAAWDAGRRQPKAIAATWRARVHPESVCRALLRAVGHVGHDAGSAAPLTNLSVANSRHAYRH
jgi:glycosyltransferase involved in cell wall biosynthesis